MTSGHRRELVQSEADPQGIQQSTSLSEIPARGLCVGPVPFGHDRLLIFIIPIFDRLRNEVMVGLTLIVWVISNEGSATSIELAVSRLIA
ncbi:hypothetical protein H9L39_11345 [Fusarium oxysporum f. sp. albedinis]|nr:hypothetical protein H9L39_11345 [Fusarium oxysporum f. sp. albedinis]